MAIKELCTRDVMYGARNELSKHALWLAAFVGANLFQSGFTGLCPLESILRRLGVASASSAAAGPR